jgi:4,5-dihydroxyphthalate decarboxylase
MTAALWARGSFREYSVKSQEIRWCNGGLNKPGRESGPDQPACGFELYRSADRTLSDMLVSGELDGVVTARAPACLIAGALNIARLFPIFVPPRRNTIARRRCFPSCIFSPFEKAWWLPIPGWR